MSPNSDLSAWQLTIMAVVIVVALAGWLIAVFLAAREPRRHDGAAAGSAGETAAARTGEHEPVQPSPTGWPPGPRRS
jgi:hypothetical protein